MLAIPQKLGRSDVGKKRISCGLRRRKRSAASARDALRPVATGRQGRRSPIKALSPVTREKRRQAGSGSAFRAVVQPTPLR